MDLGSTFAGLLSRWRLALVVAGINPPGLPSGRGARKCSVRGRATDRRGVPPKGAVVYIGNTVLPQIRTYFAQ